MMNSTVSLPPTHAWHEWTLVPSLGVQVHVRAWTVAPADAPTLVLVAGLGVSSRYWLRLGRRLSASFRVFAPDLPGFGRSPKPLNKAWPAGPTVAEQADALIAWMDARKLGRIVLCGHSTGGQVAVEVATRRPDRVSRVVLIAPTFDPRRQHLAGYVPRLLVASAFEAPTLTPLLCFEYLTAGLPRVLQQARQFIKDPVEPKLPGLRQPTLVIAGQCDTLVPESWTDRLSAQLSDATLVTIDRVGHAPQFSAPTATAAVITNFLNHPHAERPADGTILADIDDPRHDPFGPAQPISPRVHGLLDYAFAAAAVTLPRVFGWSARTRRVLTLTAAASVATNLATDHAASLAVLLARRGPSRGAETLSAAAGDALAEVMSNGVAAAGAAMAKTAVNGPAAKAAMPMLAHANVDVISGLHLLTAALTYLRRDRPAVRLAVAAFGVCQIASSLLTAKPTGPARVQRP